MNHTNRKADDPARFTIVENNRGKRNDQVNRELI